MYVIRIARGGHRHIITIIAEDEVDAAIVLEALREAEPTWTISAGRA